MDAEGKKKNIFRELFDAICIKKTSILIFPCVIALVLDWYLIKGIVFTHPRYGTRTVTAVFGILLLWGVLFLIDQWKIYKGKRKRYIKANVVLILIIAVFVAKFMGYAIWGQGYLSLAPYERIDNGIQHLDSLFHSAVAESYKHFPYASSLLNGEEYLSYHTFSHMLMGNISRIMGMPAFITYCYLFPVIFLPLYAFAILFSISCAKYYFRDQHEIAFADVVVMTLFIVGIMLTRYLDAYAVWKTSYLLSESFEAAITLTFFTYGLIFRALKEWGGTKKRILEIVLIPVMIFIISWTKISVGFIFTVSVLYYVFRARLKEWRYWLLNFFYAGIFLLSLYLFNGMGEDVEGMASSDFKFMAFGKYCPGRLGIWGHYLLLSVFPALFIVFDIIKNRYGKKDFFAAKTVWIEDMLFVCLMAFLPGLIMDISGGSAAYFSFVCEVPAIILLCGRDYVDIDQYVKGIPRLLIYALCFFWCIFISYQNCSYKPVVEITGKHESDLSSMLMEIRDAADGEADKYSIYLDQDSVVTQVFPDGMRSIYVCPAMTGIGVINATYIQDGKCYTYLGEEAADYAVNNTDNREPISFEAALKKAGDMGKKGLIHITNSGYEIVRTEEGHGK